MSDTEKIEPTLKDGSTHNDKVLGFLNAALAPEIVLETAESIDTNSVDN